MVLVILCGGSGTRLWPASIESSPKQFASLFEDGSLFEKTIQRNSKFVNKIIVVVNEKQIDLCLEQLPKDKNILIISETAARNTAPAIALAALACSPNENMLIVPSDHLIDENHNYFEAIKRAEELASNEFIVTFGIKPLYPETGYGYIEAKGEELICFKEKPELKIAQEYAKSGKHFWNSGMFCVRADTFLAELDTYAPDIFELTSIAFKNRVEQKNTVSIPIEFMKQIPSQSIDYAIMEHTKKGKVVSSEMSWSDVGSFESLAENLPVDENGNTINKRSINLDSKNNLIMSSSATIATIGVEGLIIVQNGDKILITKKGLGQRVKEIPALLNK